MTGLLRILAAALAFALRRTASAIAGTLNAWADRLDPPPRASAGEGDPQAPRPP
jgi:hypothetical protein